MIAEWIRYYNPLGFKVIIYDSFGKFHDHIFDASRGYNLAQSLKHSKTGPKLIYHNFTYLQMLQKAKTFRRKEKYEVHM
jgi:hypothetical protein